MFRQYQYAVLLLTILAPRSQPDEAGTKHRKRCPFILPKCSRADGERANNQRIGQKQSVVACPKGLRLRIYQVGVGLVDGDLIG